MVIYVNFNRVTIPDVSNFEFYPAPPTSLPLCVPSHSSNPMAQTAFSTRGSSGVLSACGFQVWLIDQAGNTIPHLNATTTKGDVVRAQLKHLAHAETLCQQNSEGSVTDSPFTTVSRSYLESGSGLRADR